MSFKRIQTLIKNHYDSTSLFNTLYLALVPSSELWDKYIDTIEGEDVKQSYRCNSCKSFFKHYGAVTWYNNEGKRDSVWNITLPRGEEPDDTYRELKDSLKALHEIVTSAPIDCVAYMDCKTQGKESNMQFTRDGIMLDNPIERSHFFVEVPAKYIDNMNYISLRGTSRTNYSLVKFMCDTWVGDHLIRLRDSIQNGLVYLGENQINAVETVIDLKDKYNSLKEEDRPQLLWDLTYHDYAYFKNSSLGTIVTNMSKGHSFEVSLKKYEDMVAPANYKRPKPKVSEKQIQAFKDELESRGLLTAISERTYAKVEDIDLNEVLYSNRTNAQPDAFTRMEGNILVDPKAFNKYPKINISSFVDLIKSGVTTLEVLPENRHLRDLMVLITGTRGEDEPLFKWDSNLSWTYIQDVASSSIKDKVEKMGGKIDAKVRLSVAWNNSDDLDLHLEGKTDFKNYQGSWAKDLIINVFHGNTYDKHLDAKLDVDMNVNTSGERFSSTAPVENIYINKLVPGNYEVKVNNYTKRNSGGDYQVEMEYNGEIITISNPNPKENHKDTVIKFTITPDGEIIINKKPLGKPVRHKAWSLKTLSWTKVTDVCFSPNYWGDFKVGNKQLFMFVQGVVPDSQVRGLFPEYVIDEIYNQHKRALEVFTDSSRLPIPDEKTIPTVMGGIGFVLNRDKTIYIRVDRKKIYQLLLT